MHSPASAGIKGFAVDAHSHDTHGKRECVARPQVIFDKVHHQHAKFGPCATVCALTTDKAEEEIRMSDAACANEQASLSPHICDCIFAKA